MQQKKIKALKLRDLFEKNLFHNEDLNICIDISRWRWTHNEQVQELCGNYLELKNTLQKKEFEYLNDLFANIDIQNDSPGDAWLMIYLEEEADFKNAA